MSKNELGPHKCGSLNIFTAANGVIIRDVNRDSGSFYGPANIVVFNDPKEFAEWCKAWMIANAKAP